MKYVVKFEKQNKKNNKKNKQTDMKYIVRFLEIDFPLASVVNSSKLDVKWPQPLLKNVLMRVCKLLQ